MLFFVKKISFFYLQYFFTLCECILPLASASSNMRSKVKLLLIGCPRRCWAPPNPINASPSRVKRCALPYEKEATVNLGEGLSRGPRKGLQTMGRDGKGSRIITMQPSCLHLGTLSSVRVRVHMHDHLCEYTIERRIEMDTISNYLPGPDNTHFFLRRPSFCLFFASQGSFVLSRNWHFRCKVHFRSR